MDKTDFKEWLADTIDDSMDVDWTSGDAASLIISRLEDMAVLTPILAIMEEQPSVSNTQGPEGP